MKESQADRIAKALESIAISLVIISKDKGGKK